MKVWRSGPWRLAGEGALFEAARPWLEPLVRAAAADRGPRALGPTASYFKGSPLRARPALRHALRRTAFLLPPRLQEYSNLDWLREQGFLAPRPLLAGVLWRHALPRYQFLCTEFVDHAPTLEEYLSRPAPLQQRARLLGALARDVARLHAQGFVHRDLFARNLLACELDSAPRCAILDAWRGGPRRGWRGPEHDLGCFFFDGATLLSSPEQAHFLTTYRTECSALGAPPSPRWSQEVERARAAVHRREARRRPGRAETWRFPRLA
jgi:hypothetical protein